MTFDQVFENAGIAKRDPSHLDRFTYADLRAVVAYMNSLRQPLDDDACASVAEKALERPMPNEPAAASAAGGNDES